MSDKHDHDHEKEPKHNKCDPEPQTAESDKPQDPPEGPGGDDRG